MTSPKNFNPALGNGERAAYGTAPIRCGRLRCKWRGFESLLTEKPGEHGLRHKICPVCGCDSYSFMSAGEINAWERSKSQQELGSAFAAQPGKPEQAVRQAAIKYIGWHAAAYGCGAPTNEIARTCGTSKAVTNQMLANLQEQGAIAFTEVRGAQGWTPRGEPL